MKSRSEKYFGIRKAKKKWDKLPKHPKPSFCGTPILVPKGDGTWTVGGYMVFPELKIIPEDNIIPFYNHKAEYDEAFKRVMREIIFSQPKQKNKDRHPVTFEPLDEE